jgi:hypothetical protein
LRFLQQHSWLRSCSGNYHKTMGVDWVSAAMEVVPSPVIPSQIPITDGGLPLTYVWHALSGRILRRGMRWSEKPFWSHPTVLPIAVARDPLPEHRYVRFFTEWFLAGFRALSRACSGRRSGNQRDLNRHFSGHDLPDFWQIRRKNGRIQK